jgi:hypothetical protein
LTVGAERLIRIPARRWHRQSPWRRALRQHRSARRESQHSRHDTFAVARLA